MKFIDLKNKLKNEETLPAYLVKGDDEYVKSLAINMLVNAVVQDFSELNSTIVYSESIEPSKIIDACNTLPFMSNKKIVVVKETEKKLATELAGLIKEYLKNPNSSTVLVLVNGEDSCFSKLPIEVVDCNRLDAYTLTNYIKQKVKKSNKQIDDVAIKNLLEYTNFYLGKIENELDKILSMNIDVVTTKEIESNVNKDLEYTAFELTDCISSRNYNKALKIIEDLMSDYKANKTILSLLKSHFRRLMYVSLSKGTNKEIGDFLGVKEYAIDRARVVAKSFRKMTLIKINKLIDDTDFMIKSGKLIFETGINNLILSIFELQNKG